jgi:uncharacterized protein YfkK (UPF0435 family)
MAGVKDTDTVDSSKKGDGLFAPEGMTESAQNLFKIHQMVFKKSSFIKEPQLFSKEIDV